MRRNEEITKKQNNKTKSRKKNLQVTICLAFNRKSTIPDFNLAYATGSPIKSIRWDARD